MPNPTAAILVIGDEILSGRTRDANMHYLAVELTRIGIDLLEARVVSDKPESIVAAVNALRHTHDHLFTSGGIGPTHDDITADCIAQAFGVHIDVRDDALAILSAHYASLDSELNDARKRMARIPDGATLIDNPVSSAPGFTMENVHVMAGVPLVFQAMVQSVLSTVTGGSPLIARTLRIDRPESEIAGPLGASASAHPTLSMGSYPFIKNGRFGSNVVIRGTDSRQIDAALSDLQSELGGEPV